MAARCKAGRTVVVTEGTTIVISLLEGRNNPFLLLQPTITANIIYNWHTLFVCKESNLNTPAAKSCKN